MHGGVVADAPVARLGPIERHRHVGPQPPPRPLCLVEAAVFLHVIAGRVPKRRLRGGRGRR
eukprot:4191058-Lingulodinium_polyedra.AAC.1